MIPVKLIFIGAGSRGATYASYSNQHPNLVQIVGVAEPREFYRRKMVNLYDIPAQHVVSDWKKLLNMEKFADAVVIATPDKLHADMAIAFTNKGYDILLEKPMALNENDCRKIARAALDNNVIFAVCHVLRYNQYTQKLKSIVDSGEIGDIVSMQHLEPIGYWHYAHSYVRGNWRNEKESSFALLTKSCHDLDWIYYIVNRRCLHISSFGSLKHFRKENKPANAADRCYYCDYEVNCPYSAKRFYLGQIDKGNTGWPVDVITDQVSEENVIFALKKGPYGRCVYNCDNDVIDHQVVNMMFEDDISATFTMTAFTETTARKTRIFGTKGELYGDGTTLQIYDFLTEKMKIVNTSEMEYVALGGHGGGDYELVKSFVAAVAEKNPKKIFSGAEDSLASHLIVFAAEKARRQNCVVTLK